MLTSLIRETLGGMSANVCMLAHASPSVSAYNETLQTIQIASRVYRMKVRKKYKVSLYIDALFYIVINLLLLLLLLLLFIIIIVIIVIIQIDLYVTVFNCSFNLYVCIRM